MTDAGKRQGAGLPPICAGARRALLARLLVLGLFEAALAGLGALGVRWLVEASRAGAALPWPVLLLGLGGALAAAQLGLQTLRGRWAERLAQHYAREVRSALLAHLLGMSPREHTRMRRGHLMVRMGSELGALQRWVGRGLAPALSGAAVLAGLLVLVALLAPGFAPWQALVLLVFGLLGWRVSRQLETRLRAERRERWALSGVLGERLADAAVVQACGQPARELRRLGRMQDRLAAAAEARATQRAVLRALPAAAVGLMIALAFAWGSAALAQGQLRLQEVQVGSLAALLMLTGLAALPLRDMAGALAAWRAWRVSREKISSFLQRHSTGLARAVPPAITAGALRIVAARTAEGLGPIDFEAAAGSSVALHGPPGSGKSSLLQIAAGWIDPVQGHVEIDGQNLAGLGAAALAGRVALVGVDLPLLRGSIESNLRYACPGADTARIEGVIDAVGLRAALERMPGGLQTRVRESGRNLPLRLRLRIALARALLRRPALLLIDDFDGLLAHDASDAALEALLRTPERTTVIVSADPQWQRRCDRSVELQA